MAIKGFTLDGYDLTYVLSAFPDAIETYKKVIASFENISDNNAKDEAYVRNCLYHNGLLQGICRFLDHKFNGPIAAMMKVKFKGRRKLWISTPPEAYVEHIFSIEGVRDSLQDRIDFMEWALKGFCL